MQNITSNETVEYVEGVYSVTNKEGRKLFVVGDSTLSPFNDLCYYPRYGYGTKLQDYLRPDEIQVVNLAMSGRSSRSFLKEVNYQTLQNNIKAGDYLLIGFGHNDEKPDPARYTNSRGSKEDVGSFKHTLYQYYIKLAFAHGAIPILTTPIVRRAPGTAYTDNYVHVTADIDGYQGGDYPQAIRDLGKECSVFVVDNTKITKELYEKLGDNETVKFHAWLTASSDSVDNTHLNIYGASVIAYNVINVIKNADAKFACFVKNDIASPTENMLHPAPVL